MGITTDPNDPRLGHGVDSEPIGQHDVYLVLSADEREKGFVRPYRDRYIHRGQAPRYSLRELTDDEKERYKQYGYIAFEQYPEDSGSLGRYWTQKQLDAKGCGTETIMGAAIAETYARSPHFYGATYCCGCSRHLPVSEFVWSADGQIVGT